MSQFRIRHVSIQSSFCTNFVFGLYQSCPLCAGTCFVLGLYQSCPPPVTSLCFILCPSCNRFCSHLVLGEVILLIFVPALYSVCHFCVTPVFSLHQLLFSSYNSFVPVLCSVHTSINFVLYQFCTSLLLS